MKQPSDDEIQQLRTAMEEMSVWRFFLFLMYMETRGIYHCPVKMPWLERLRIIWASPLRPIEWVLVRIGWIKPWTWELKRKGII